MMITSPLSRLLEPAQQKLHQGLSALPRLALLGYLFVAMLCIPLQANAGWTDSGISGIKTNVSNIIDTISDAQKTISDQKLKNMITDIRAMLQTAVDTQQDGVSGFLNGGNCTKNDGSPCGDFKYQLTALLEGIEGLNNSLLSMHAIPNLDIQIQDPGLGNIINQLPGRVLFPLYKVLQNTPILHSGFVESIQDTQVQVAELSDVLFPKSTPFAASSASMSAASDLNIPSGEEACEAIQDNSDYISGAAVGLIGIGNVAKIIGATFEASSKTIFAGPVEMDAGIHGYVHGTIHQNWPHVIGKLVSGFGHVLTSTGDYGFSKVKFCGVLLRNLETLDNQAIILANQEEILLGQERMLCAFKHNHPEECVDFVGNGYGNRGSKTK